MTLDYAAIFFHALSGTTILAICAIAWVVHHPELIDAYELKISKIPVKKE